MSKKKSLNPGGGEINKGGPWVIPSYATAWTNNNNYYILFILHFTKYTFLLNLIDVSFMYSPGLYIQSTLFNLFKGNQLISLIYLDSRINYQLHVYNVYIQQ